MMKVWKCSLYFWLSMLMVMTTLPFMVEPSNSDIYKLGGVLFWTGTVWFSIIPLGALLFEWTEMSFMTKLKYLLCTIAIPFIGSVILYFHRQRDLNKLAIKN
ncbi:hypothetical protein L2755_06415 [Shewanella abyssi]|uniref:hypothetical protein n=1 Tax=Shewanella abyssi TaxID=311789 RepID=UPI002010A650|nr:hypothetical protein [Shewanella abyssi]MCL1049258.1 hypothetical protein [Shewanella abyssi]